ncbi:MAG: hypothetical protein EA383_16875 [Spirochaetaceae bacterium]|nr:MAG: hypothetical protein EA383_16875 [Spirochaetaceae bacterium]
MCPDDQLLSAHFDHEVPSPWKEQLDRIIDSDIVCRQKFDRIAAVHTALHAGAEPDFDAAKDRIWDSIQSRTAYVQPHQRFRTVSISLPLAAAAAMAILAVGVLASYMLLRTPGNAATAGVFESGVTIRVDDVEQLLRIINSGDPVRQVQIDLPEQSRFQFSGEPRLIRAVDQGGERPFGETEQP